MVAQRKLSESEAILPTVPADPAARRATGDEAPVHSPAHTLQARLGAELDRPSPSPSMRTVLATLILFCFAVWLALFLLVASFARGPL